jgi:hypothetical protein
MTCMPANLFLIYGLKKRLTKNLAKLFVFAKICGRQEQMREAARKYLLLSQKLNYFCENLRENRKSLVIFAKFFQNIKLFGRFLLSEHAH